MPELSILSLLQVLVGLGLLNVWLVRARSATDYRGGEAKTLQEEFQAYGLPDFTFYLVGGLKIVAGLALVIGLWVDLPVRIAGGVVGLLMVGALVMHVKVGDPPMRSLPAALMLLMSAGIILLG
jgi:uncharacterized membrane protein YphA (DoxX/SURF4 family)